MEPQGLRDSSQVVIEITVSDTGCGIESARLESIFRELEQVEHSSKVESTHSDPGLGEDSHIHDRNAHSLSHHPLCQDWGSLSWLTSLDS